MGTKRSEQGIFQSPFFCLSPCLPVVVGYPGRRVCGHFPIQVRIPATASPHSRRTDAVKAPGIIRPLRIAEIERSVGEFEGSEHRPYGAGQIGAGFHHDGDIGRAGDVEPKLIVRHAKAAVPGWELSDFMHDSFGAVGLPLAVENQSFAKGKMDFC